MARALDEARGVYAARLKNLERLPSWTIFIAPLLLVCVLFIPIRIAVRLASIIGSAHAAFIPPQSSPFLYTFNVPGTVYEADSPQDSASPYFWLNSGGKLIITGEGFGETIQGALPRSDSWYQEYADSNPDDTDGGAHPQNLFRLVTESSWDNVSAQAAFYIAGDELSASSNRNASNGLLLMSRYQDNGETLYYAGLRVDGTAVIKKKYHGTYYTMAEASVFSGIYDPNTNPNLLPHKTWIALRATTVTDAAGTVTITLSLAQGNGWKELLTATDSGQYDDTPPITGSAPQGIRTDFMDVLFKNYELESLPSSPVRA